MQIDQEIRLIFVYQLSFLLIFTWLDNHYAAVLTHQTSNLKFDVLVLLLICLLRKKKARSFIEPPVVLTANVISHRDK